MKLSLVVFFGLVLHFGAQSQATSPIIRSTEMEWINLVPDGENCEAPTFQSYQDWTGLEPDSYRTAFIADGQELELWTETFTAPVWQLLWKIDRLTGPNLPEHIELSGEEVNTQLYFYPTSGRLPYEKYLVSLYRINPLTAAEEFTDWIHVFVLPDGLGMEQALHYGFDQGNLSATAPVDAYGRGKVTKGPLFSGTGNRRSDLNPISEKANDLCFYGAYGTASDNTKPGQSSRGGDGYMTVFNPPTSKISGVEQPLDQVCEPYNPFTYDFCSDACGVFDEAVPYEAFIDHQLSLCSNVEVNVHTHHQTGSESYYGFSFRIPEGFVEEGMNTDGTNALGNERRHILAEFMQPDWPISAEDASYPCSPLFQLMYLGDNNLAIQYGLKGFNQCAFGPWLIEKGEWVDVIIHMRWEHILDDNAPAEAFGDEGLFEIWLNRAGGGYEKLCLLPSTDDYQDKRAFGDHPLNTTPFSATPDSKTVFGPNLINPNPAYLSLKSKRAVGYNGTCGMDFISAVHHDELRVGQGFDEVMIPGAEVLDNASLSCQPEDFSGAMLSKASWEEIEKEITVYPNPATEWVNVESATASTYVKVSLLDLGGRTVYSERFEAIGGQLMTRVPVQGLNPGMYVLVIDDGGEVRSAPLQVK